MRGLIRLLTPLNKLGKPLALWNTSRPLTTYTMAGNQGPDHGKGQKRRNQGRNDGQWKAKKKQNKVSTIAEGSHDEVLRFDVQSLLSAQQSDADVQETAAAYEPPEQFSEIEITVSMISSTGDGLALSKNGDHVYVVPFTTPGDVVKAKVVRYNKAQNYTLTDFVSVVQPSAQRDDSRVKCPYFASCSGCQFQMMSYADQLDHKKSILERAYKNFSDIAPEYVPSIDNTIGSPLEYGYRTKLTPHFDGPPGGRRSRRENAPPQWGGVPPIGFMLKGTRKTIDIEDCPIGTDAVRAGMKSERARVATEINNYKRGATLLLRESTERVPVSNEPEANGTDSAKPYTETKTCITDQVATSTEYVDDYIFTNPAGSFFQNNNSILPRFTQYIREHILGSTESTGDKPKIKHLLDCYSGSGLFTITLSPLFTTSTGIDVSPSSIAYASKNAELNKLSNTSFQAADAAAIFDGLKVDPDETAVVIDPSRKGCDEQFLRLLLEFAPRRVVYVSCNVHTQARDVGCLVEGSAASMSKTAQTAKTVKDEPDADVGKQEMETTNESDNVEMTDKQAPETTRRRTRYRIESLQGFDFFPQTGHVEGVAVLERVDDEAK
jgi:tRNA (uracil-5-)-methyltransferase